MNHEKLSRQFWDQGYLVLENFFQARLMAQLNGLIKLHFGENPDFCHEQEFLEKSQTEVIPWFPQQAGESRFDIAQNDSRMKSITEAILGPGWYSLYCMAMFSPPGSRGQAWHQDCPPTEKREA